MPDIGKVLKDEIARIAKRESKIMLASHIATIRQLKLEVTAMKKQMPKPVKPVAAQAAEAGEAGKRGVWFTSRGIKGLRMRLGLSQAQVAKLCSVSSNAVGLWENANSGKLNLRGRTRDALARLRKLTPAAAKKALVE